MIAAVHSSLKTSPAFFNFGREPRSPRTIKRREEGQPETIGLSVHQWKDRVKRLQLSRDLVTLHFETASGKQERYYNRKHSLRNKRSRDALTTRVIVGSELRIVKIGSKI